MLISHVTSKNADTNAFFTAEPAKSLVFGGLRHDRHFTVGCHVHFRAGQVRDSGFSYYQVVPGYIVGYVVIAQVLMPLYYRLNLVSIYTYLRDRWAPSPTLRARRFHREPYLGFGHAFVFGFERIAHFSVRTHARAVLGNGHHYVGAYLAVHVQRRRKNHRVDGFVPDDLPYFIGHHLYADHHHQIGLVQGGTHECTQRNGLFHDVPIQRHQRQKPFPETLFRRAFIAIAMTGLDQDLMQKNLTCRNIGDAQKNMYSFTTILVIVNLLFLVLGALLYLYAAQFNVSLPTNPEGKIITDNVFPHLALKEFGVLAGVFFLLGIIASSFASADSALTALTTSFCIDFLPWNRYAETTKAQAKNWVHVGFSALFFIIILVSRQLADQALIDLILKLAGYTYGPFFGPVCFWHPVPIRHPRPLGARGLPAFARALFCFGL